MRPPRPSKPFARFLKCRVVIAILLVIPRLRLAVLSLSEPPVAVLKVARVVATTVARPAKILPRRRCYPPTHMPRVFALIVLLALAATLAHSAEPTYNIGPGSQTCTNWLAARLGAQSPGAAHDPDRLLVSLAVGWIQGVIVGAAATMPPPTNLKTLAEIPEPAKFTPWIDVYCRTKPGDDLLKASLALHFEVVRRAAAKK